MLFLGIMSPMTKTILEMFIEVYFAKNYLNDYKDLPGQYRKVSKIKYTNIRALNKRIPEILKRIQIIVLK